VALVLDLVIHLLLVLHKEQMVVEVIQDLIWVVQVVVELQLLVQLILVVVLVDPEELGQQLQFQQVQ
tara:strand:+ start:142 stop:342 length:201 start_codon:yes stop_codon:yes gene_type:complete